VVLPHLRRDLEDFPNAECHGRPYLSCGMVGLVESIVSLVEECFGPRRLRVRSLHVECHLLTTTFTHALESIVTRNSRHHLVENDTTVLVTFKLANNRLKLSCGFHYYTFKLIFCDFRNCKVQTMVNQGVHDIFPKKKEFMAFRFD
jgi:hypothetical protein